MVYHRMLMSVIICTSGRSCAQLWTRQIDRIYTSISKHTPPIPAGGLDTRTPRSPHDGSFSSFQKLNFFFHMIFH